MKLAYAGMTPNDLIIAPDFSARMTLQANHNPTCKVPGSLHNEILNVSYIEPGKTHWHDCSDGSRRLQQENVCYSFMADAFEYDGKKNNEENEQDRQEEGPRQEEEEDDVDHILGLTSVDVDDLMEVEDVGEDTDNANGNDNGDSNNRKKRG